MTFRDWYYGPDGAKWPVRELARALGCATVTMHALVAPSPRIPRPEMVRAIYRLTGGVVSPNDWYSDLHSEGGPEQPPTDAVIKRARKRLRTSVVEVAA